LTKKTRKYGELERGKKYGGRGEINSEREEEGEIDTHRGREEEEKS